MKIISSITPRVKPNGKLIYITSSLSNFRKLIEYTKVNGFDVNIIAKKKLFFEELIIIEAIKLFS